MRPRNINLHIEELVLHGFAPNDRYAIAEAVEQELFRLLGQSAAQGPADLTTTLTRHSSNPRIEAGAFQVQQNFKPGSIGNQIAGSVYGGLTK